MSISVPPPTLLPENIFVPQQYTFSQPVNLFAEEKVYIKLILQIGEEFIANNLMNLVIAGWYNVTFDNYPSLRALLPANYTDTIVGLAGQVTIAIQNLNAKDPEDAALHTQFIPIGRRHYMHGAEAVTLLCSSPCLVQSMYNVLVSTIDRIVGLLRGVLEYPNLFSAALQEAGHIKKEPSPALARVLNQVLASAPNDAVKSKVNELLKARSPKSAPASTPPAWTPAERSLLLSTSIAPDGPFPKPDQAVTFVRMMNPPSLTYGGWIPPQTVPRIFRAGAGAGAGAGANAQADLLKDLVALVAKLPLDLLFVMLEGLMTLFSGEQIVDMLTKLFQLLTGDLSAFGSDPESILNGIVTFIIQYLVPVLLIPFGRFVDVMVGIINQGVATERSIRLLASWDGQLKLRAEELARNFWWTLLEIDPDLRLPLGLQTGTQLELRLDELTTALADGLTRNFPSILNGGLPFKQQLMGLGKVWGEAGWPTSGYDAARLAFLATIDSMLFADPVYAATVPAVRLKDSFSQLVSVVNTEFVYGAGGNAFNAVGGILGGLTPPRKVGDLVRAKLQFGAATVLFQPYRTDKPVRFTLTLEKPDNGTYGVLISDLSNGNARVFASDPNTGLKPNTPTTFDYTGAQSMRLLVQANWSLLGTEELKFTLAAQPNG